MRGGKKGALATVDKGCMQAGWRELEGKVDGKV